MPDIILPIVHPVPVPRRNRDGGRTGIAIGRALSEGRIASVPRGAFRPLPFPFMDDPRAPTPAWEHGGRVWTRVGSSGVGPDGASRIRDVPLDAVVAAMGRDQPGGLLGMLSGTPLIAWESWDRGPAPEVGDPAHGATLAACRIALAAYLRDDLLASDGHLYVRIGLPCLSGTGAPQLHGAGPGWRVHDDPAVTRHDRVDAHVGYVRRRGGDGDADRFRYLAGLVERVATGIVPDEMATGLFANRLASLAFRVVEADERRLRGAALGERRDRMRAILGRLAPTAALGLVGALPPDGHADRVRSILAALAEADLGKGARDLVDGLVAYAEAVALPALEPSGPETEADIAALTTLGP